jgi:hypothetical protein
MVIFLNVKGEWPNCYSLVELMSSECQTEICGMWLYFTACL